MTPCPLVLWWLSTQHQLPNEGVKGHGRRGCALHIGVCGLLLNYYKSYSLCMLVSLLFSVLFSTYVGFRSTLASDAVEFRQSC